MSIDSFDLHCVQMWNRKEEKKNHFKQKKQMAKIYLSKNLWRVNKNFSMIDWNKFHGSALLRTKKKRTQQIHDLIDSSFYSRILRSTTANFRKHQRKEKHIPYSEFVDYLFTLDNPQRWNQQKKNNNASSLFLHFLCSWVYVAWYKCICFVCIIILHYNLHRSQMFEV